MKEHSMIGVYELANVGIEAWFSRLSMLILGSCLAVISIACLLGNKKKAA